MKLVAFCEAPADFRLASGLVDRVLREAGPPWVADNLDSPEAIRSWQPDGVGRAYFDLHRLDHYAEQLGVRTVRGHFNGQPGGAGAAMARKAFLIVRALNKTIPDAALDAAVLVWDADHQGDERRRAVAAARDEARLWAAFHIVCGVPDPEREAWVLAGFHPCDDAERDRLEALHRELGFSPVVHPARLRDRSPGATRNLKRVLGHLTADDPDREARCWTEPSLEALRERGVDSGLAAFLDELTGALLAIVDPARAADRRRE